VQKGSACHGRKGGGQKGERHVAQRGKWTEAMNACMHRHVHSWVGKRKMNAMGAIVKCKCGGDAVPCGGEVGGKGVQGRWWWWWQGGVVGQPAPRVAASGQLSPPRVAATHARSPQPMPTRQRWSRYRRQRVGAPAYFRGGQDERGRLGSPGVHSPLRGGEAECRQSRLRPACPASVQILSCCPSGCPHRDACTSTHARVFNPPTHHPARPNVPRGEERWGWGKVREEAGRW